MIRLVIAPLNYSSWSVRAWLALDHAGADFKTSIAVPKYDAALGA